MLLKEREAIDMEYMKIIERSFSNAWRYKFLWLFGFFVSISNGFGGGRIWDDKWERSDLGFRFRHFFDIDPVIIILGVLALVVLGLIFWLLSVLSEGALIHGISRKESGLETGFKECLDKGWNRFFRLLGIIVLAIFTAMFLLFVLVAFIVPAFFLSKPLGVMLLLMAIPLFFAAVFVIVATEGWAIRYGILFDRPWLESIGQGWNLFKSNIPKTLGVAFSSFLSQLIAWLLLVFCLVIVAIPLVLIGYMNFWAGVIPGAILLFLAVVISSAIFGVFSSSVWTIGFMKLTGYNVSDDIAVSSAA